NCIWTAVERERLTDDGGVAAESPLPKTVTQQHDVGRARTVFARLKGAPDNWLDAERLEKIGGPARALNPLWRAAPGQSEPAAAISRHRLERLIPPPVQKIRIRRFAPRELFLRRHLPQMHQTIWLAVRQSTQQRGVDHGKDGGVGADAHRECDDGDQREAGILQQRPRAITQVLPECGHKTLLRKQPRSDEFIRHVTIT